METTYVTINGWTDKEEVVYSEIEYDLAVKKMKSSIFRNMDGPWRCYAKVKWVRQRKTNTVISLTCGI